jgi:glucose/mannose-6-phosphate isomerase
VAVSSYSGNTEETLAMYADAIRRGCRIVAITAGGEVARRAAEAGIPVFGIGYESQPRAAFAHGLAPLLRLARQLDLTAINGAEIEGAAAAHAGWVASNIGPAIPTGRNPAKTLAVALAARTTWVIGGDHLSPAAHRFKNQLAENGKALAAAEALPEAGHNLVVGLDGPVAELTGCALVTLESAHHQSAPVARRFPVVADLFAQRGIPVHRFRLPGATPLADVLLATALGDFTSIYLALVRGLDPTPIHAIDELKRRTAPPSA